MRFIFKTDFSYPNKHASLYWQASTFPTVCEFISNENVTRLNPIYLGFRSSKRFYLDYFCSVQIIWSILPKGTEKHLQFQGMTDCVDIFNNKSVLCQPLSSIFNLSVIYNDLPAFRLTSCCVLLTFARSFGLSIVLLLDSVVFGWNAFEQVRQDKGKRMTA